VNPVCHFELEVLPGLEPLALEECSRHGVSHVALKEKGKLFARFSPEHLPRLLALKLVASAHVVISVPGKRPATLRGHQALQTTVSVVKIIREATRFETETCRFVMQGSDSPEALRIREEIARHCALQEGEPVEGEKAGEHLFRIRRSLFLDGWDVVIRISPKPLSARKWRVTDYRGALHANIGAAMVHLLEAHCGHLLRSQALSILDPFCGSGTVLCELMSKKYDSRKSFGGLPIELCGGDISLEALEACRENTQALAQKSAHMQCELYEGSATQIPMASGMFDTLVTNPPWGEAHGKAQEIEALYEKFFQEAYRVLKAGGILMICTQAIQTMSHLLKQYARQWERIGELSVFNGSFRPTLYVLRKNTGYQNQDRRSEQ
jgi:tRNA (guanine6-N2)-methyltransferase